MEVLPQFDNYSNVVVRLNFTYGDDSAALSGSCLLPPPSDDFVSFDNISKEIALDWLRHNCPNTTEEFDAQLDSEITQKKNPSFYYNWAID